MHHSAAEGFEAGAAAYTAGRPGDPDAIGGWLESGLGLAPGRTALDLDAGTGKFTPRIAATGARVVAVEPVAAMRAEFARENPRAELREGRAGAIPLPDASVDAVVCAQSFHWRSPRSAGC